MTASSECCASSALENLTRSVTDRLSCCPDCAIIGIHTGGVWIAEHLQQQLPGRLPLGTLDISFYRDDFSHVGLHPEVRPSRIPFDIDGRHIILVDDVLYTGRTVRAALNEIFDYGRPASVLLAVLIQRDGRQLPVAADCAGDTVKLQDNEQIKLSGPSPLGLEVVRLP